GEGEAGVGCFSFLLRMIIILLFGDFIPWKSLTSPCLELKFKSVPLGLAEGRFYVVKSLGVFYIKLIRWTLYKPSNSRKKNFGVRQK
ncbi:hypothetical protein, partial [Nostoc sp.]|uniref:hypothetical protein n=1 Tax=Nostoc sp. TaxID=1180 RepID=UPI002FF6BD27